MKYLKRTAFTFSALAAFAFILTACNMQEMPEESTEKPEAAHEMEAISAPPKAVCVLYPTEGNEVSGTVTFTKVNDGIKVTAEVSGLTPGSMHGFHIHQYGDCSAADGTSAGGHFNPADMDHGAPSDSVRHVGDLGNLEANAEGVAVLEFVDSKLAMQGAHSILGRGIIVHAGEDDLKSQPTGNAGARIACGVIGVAKE